MPSARYMGIPFQSRSHTVAYRQSFVFDLPRLHPQGKKIRFAHLGLTKLGQAPNQDQNSPQDFHRPKEGRNLKHATKVTSPQAGPKV
jgi:hypothetical protein